MHAAWRDRSIPREMIAFMIISNVYLTIFAFGMLGCVLSTPLVTWIANRVGAIDQPDHFRRVHQGAVPRLGGLALAFGVATATLLTYVDSSLGLRASGGVPISSYSLLIAALVILLVGFVDDTRSLGPRMKLLGQAAAILALYVGDVRIRSIEFLNLNFDLTYPAIALSRLGLPFDVSVPSLLATLIWFLGCMNVWNLIDGMDGLASGVGLLVSATLTLVAIHTENFEAAVLSVALAGSLAGFLLYNWHPACIFLGDSGSMLIGLLIGVIGVIGVKGSMGGPSAISILFPIVAMGLPISDTAMAIFRRWVRNLPLSAADRRHVHHLLMNLGLNPRLAALMLYSFSAFLCGAVMLGLALENEYVTLVLGIFGCLAFLLVVTSRRDELANLREDLQDRLTRGRQERTAAKLTWEAIQRIELSGSADAAGQILDRAAIAMGCRAVRIGCGEPDRSEATQDIATGDVSGPSAIFRLSGGQGHWITMEVGLGAETPLAADIVFRYVHRLGQALADRIERLKEATNAEPPAGIAATDLSPRLDRTHPMGPEDLASAPSDSRRGGWIVTLFGRIARIPGRIGFRSLAAGVAGPPAPRPATDRLAGPHRPARP
jgi:UDP-GlcNAc:undecaprenyl-phosphate/decaprenyl-phosphate GlcNAc-1-phosphate transferase